MATFTPYQVDYSAKNASKTFGFSKKRVSFKFGFANEQAVQAGESGAACRGSEHEVIFIWSLNSGKRQILADGKDVHFSESGQNGWTNDQVFQHKFHLKVPGFNAPFKCHLITAPVQKDMPGSRPFELRVNGVSFFQFGKIYELGTPQMVVRPVHRHRSSGMGYGGYSGNPDDDPYMSPEERQAIAAAKLESLKDLAQSQQQQSYAGSTPSVQSLGQKEEASLISFDDPVPPPVPARGSVQQVSSLTIDPSIQQPPPAQNQPQGAYGQPPPQGQPAYSNYSLPPAQARSSWPAAAPAPAASGSMTPYYSQPGGNAAPAPAPYANYGYGAPAPAPATGFGAPPPAPGAAYAYGVPPPASGYGAPQQSRPSLTSPSNQSYASYGSAPSFAQPPQNQQAGARASFSQPPPQQQQYGQAAPQQQYGFAQPPQQNYSQY